VSGWLRNVCKLADLKMDRLLDTIDEWIAVNGAEDDARDLGQYLVQYLDMTCRSSFRLAV